MKNLSKFFFVSLLGLALCSFTQVSETEASYDQVTSLETSLDYAVAKSFTESYSSSATSDKGSWSKWNKDWTLVGSFANLNEMQKAIEAVELPHK